MEVCPVPGAATGHVNAVANGRRGYKTKGDRKLSRPLHPGAWERRRRKLPDRSDHPYVDVESTQNVELVVEDTEAAGQNGSHGTRPGRANSGQRVGHGIVPEDAIGGSGSPGCRAAHAIDVRYPEVGEHATRHVTHLGGGAGIRDK